MRNRDIQHALKKEGIFKEVHTGKEAETTRETDKAEDTGEHEEERLCIRNSYGNRDPTPAEAVKRRIQEIKNQLRKEKKNEVKSAVTQ